MDLPTKLATLLRPASPFRRIGHYCAACFDGFLVALYCVGSGCVGVGAACAASSINCSGCAHIAVIVKDWATFSIGRILDNG